MRHTEEHHGETSVDALFTSILGDEWTRATITGIVSINYHCFHLRLLLMIMFGVVIVILIMTIFLTSVIFCYRL